MRLLAGEHGQVTAAGDDDQAIHRLRGAAAKNLRDFEAEWPAAKVVRLEESLRCPERILTAALAVAEPAPDRIEKALRAIESRPPGEVAFWRCESERAQAQAVAAEIERLVARDKRSGDEASGRGRGRASSGWIPSERGRSVLATACGGEAPRESVVAPMSMRSCRWACRSRW
jgi:DNA helicase-2/ATP-dependent DNA helicase PcrA